MGLRCSLLGHDYGDVVVERDRQERGDEVVVTERELRECNRCGAEDIFSENTEVRRRRPDEYEQPETETEQTAPDAMVQEAEDEAAEEIDDAIILDDEPPAEEPVSDSGGTDESSSADDVDEQAPESEPADEMIEAEASAEPSEPAPPDQQQTESSWPESGQEREQEADTEVEREWPNDPRDPADRAEESVFQFPDDVEESDPRSGIASAGPIETTQTGDDDLEGSLTCPACGFSVRMKRSSLRAGDICPDCHAGYLAEGR